MKKGKHMLPKHRVKIESYNTCLDMNEGVWDNNWSKTKSIVMFGQEFIYSEKDSKVRWKM